MAEVAVKRDQCPRLACKSVKNFVVGRAAQSLITDRQYVVPVVTQELCST